MQQVYYNMYWGHVDIMRSFFKEQNQFLRQLRFAWNLSLVSSSADKTLADSGISD